MQYGTEEFGSALSDLVAWLRQESAIQGLSLTALSLLRRLDRGSMRITEIAAAEQMTQPGGTSMVKRLESAGLVARADDPDDARAVQISITEQGRGRLNDYRRRRSAQLDSLMHALDDDERSALLAVTPTLRKLVASTRSAHSSNNGKAYL